MPTPTPSVLVFDVNETLIDIDSIAPLFGELFGDRRLLREWFGQLGMYSMTATLSECYVDFFTLGQGVLRMLADIYRVDITDEEVLRLKAAMLTMPAHPDTAAGLLRLRDNGFRLVTLTNSPPNPEGPTPLENATGRAFRAHFKRRPLPRLQAVASGLSVCVPRTRGGTQRLHDGGGARVGHPRRTKCRLQDRSHHALGQPPAAG